jgi:hypothetical protein
MKKYVYLFSVLAAVLSLGLVTISASAQDETAEEGITCEVDIVDIMDEVEQYCTGIGRDQVCYGNVEVNAIPRQQQIDLNFENPGDSADVSLIRSLYLSAMDVANDSWGIAQMRLLANLTQQRPEEVTLLLFGDVSVEDTSEPRVELEVTVNEDFAARIRNVPSINSLVIDVAQPGENVMAVGRLEDNSWIRVKEDELGRVGWVAADLLMLDGLDVESLTVDEADTPYFGAMQAFLFESGQSNACGSTISDGLLIQTPEGVARLTLLINEVSIELLGADGGATALVEANSSTGMNINMLNGSANVSVDGSTVVVNTNTGVNVPLDESLSPVGSVSSPGTTNVSTVQGVVLLPLINNMVDTLFPGQSNNSDRGNRGNRENRGNRNGRGEDQGNHNGQQNGTDNRGGNRDG